MMGPWRDDSDGRIDPCDGQGIPLPRKDLSVACIGQQPFDGRETASGVGDRVDVDRSP